MQKVTTVQIPEFFTNENGEQTKVKYLGQYLDKNIDFPRNCLFSKGLTGCGGTHYILNNEEDAIIAVPFVNLIKSKVGQNDTNTYKVFGVHGGDETTKAVSHQDIVNYITAQKDAKLPIKIMVTYDSLLKVVGAVEFANMNCYKDVFLLVDEWHILFNQYIFRHKAISGLLKIAKNFDSVTYMTATPIEARYMLREFKNLPIVEYQWQNVEKVNIIPTQTNKLKNHLKKLCRSFIDGKILGNAHIFLNSVTTIAEIIRIADLKPEQVKIICSRNGGLNKKKFKKGFNIEDTNGAAKKINFYTSTAFEGCDVDDREGRIYVVSDSSKKHTLLDISTLFVQICGRIRNTRYATQVEHIFTGGAKYKTDVTLEEYIKTCEKLATDTEKQVKFLNSADTEMRKSIFDMMEKRGVFNDMYVTREDGEIAFDTNMINVDIINFKVTHHLYTSSVMLHDEYKKHGFSSCKTNWESYADKIASEGTAKIKFADVFSEYVELRRNPDMAGRDERLEIIEAEKPFIVPAYNELGRDRVAELEFNVQKIKRELVKIQKINDRTKAFKIIRREFESFKPIENIKIVAKLQSIYTSLGIDDKAKVSHLKYWFTVKASTVTDKKGNTCRATTIVKANAIMD